VKNAKELSSKHRPSVRDPRKAAVMFENSYQVFVA